MHFFSRLIRKVVNLISKLSIDFNFKPTYLFGIFVY
uniref:Uncharacterized protein n=1 Tax=Rhizophora mucronata TaxID=61149 RepID=A0A2P2NUW9_RHIMU